jgi:hypothetical protein
MLSDLALSNGNNPKRKGKGGAPPESTRFEKIYGAQKHEIGKNNLIK